MQLLRPAFAPHPCRFGRGPLRSSAPEAEAERWQVSDDVKLFATTFAAGFVFVSILIG